VGDYFHRPHAGRSHAKLPAFQKRNTTMKYSPYLVGVYAERLTRRRVSESALRDIAQDRSQNVNIRIAAVELLTEQVTITDDLDAHNFGVEMSDIAYFAAKDGHDALIDAALVARDNASEIASVIREARAIYHSPYYPRFSA
jgi:hypothetical protein